MTTSLSQAAEPQRNPAPSGARTFASDNASALAWSKLTPVQQFNLAPLQPDWHAIDSVRQRKWLELASRMSAMPAAERERVQQRMSQWAQLTPEKRNQARQQFLQSREMPAPQRQARWNEYQALKTPPPVSSANSSAQVKPGATTRPVTSPLTPPAHHQPGMPKIMAKDGFVDPSTLLPKRGPQGAAVSAALSSDSPAKP